jgi:hypothetical protein
MEKLLPTSGASPPTHFWKSDTPEEKIIGGYSIIKPLSLRNALVFRVKKTASPDESSNTTTYVLKLTKTESLEYEKKFLEKFRGDRRIVQLVDEIEERGIKGLVLEDINGIDLQDYLESIPENRLSEVERIMISIADLESCH